MRSLFKLFLALFLASIVFSYSPSSTLAQSNVFKMSEALLKKLAEEDAPQFSLNVKLNARGPLHTLSDDCEMHLAGKAINFDLGIPKAVVVEPPNLCKFAPSGTPGSSNLGAIWGNLLDSKVINKNCSVKGFFRIFTEHIGSGGGPSNPGHAFEIHPATSLICSGEEISFGNMLKIFPGMRHAQPSTAARCINEKELFIRFKNGKYELQENTVTCGNFAIIEVDKIRKSWVREVNGGHSAIARTTANGTSLSTLKLYTITGSEADDWLDQVINQGLSGETKILHGMFTYDYQSTINTVRNEEGEWLKPNLWERVDFPLAIVVFGETETVPWE